jgi:uroporphyrinogen-III synthase
VIEKLPSNQSSAPLEICSFESRRAAEMQVLIEKQGGIATVAPSMQEVTLGDNPEVFSFVERLFEGRIDVVIFFTGVGAKSLLEIVATKHDTKSFFAALNRCTVIVRGPKPVAVLRDWNVHIDHKAAEPNTWREILDVIDAELDVAHKTISVQEYGKPNEEFTSQLEQRGATVVSVPVYRWAMPDDLGPLLAAIRSTIAREFDVLMFTSANQLSNVLDAADSINLREDWLAAASKCAIASIGPTASEAIRDAGLPVDVEASPPKMGRLVRQTIESAPEIFKSKHSGS